MRVILLLPLQRPSSILTLVDYIGFEIVLCQTIQCETLLAGDAGTCLTPLAAASDPTGIRSFLGPDDVARFAFLPSEQTDKLPSLLFGCPAVEIYSADLRLCFCVRSLLPTSMV